MVDNASFGCRLVSSGSRGGLGAIRLGYSSDAHLITCHISHSAVTELQYYQAIVGDRHSLHAYRSMEGLRKREHSDGDTVTDRPPQLPRCQDTAQSEHEGDLIKIDPQFIKAGEFQ